MTSPRRFRLERVVFRCASASSRAHVLYTNLATFPNFQLAWDNVINMVTDSGGEVTGCHYDPDRVSPCAEFTVLREASIEEYRIVEARV